MSNFSITPCFSIIQHFITFAGDLAPVVRMTVAKVPRRLSILERAGTSDAADNSEAVAGVFGGGDGNSLSPSLGASSMTCTKNWRPYINKPA